MWWHLMGQTGAGRLGVALAVLVVASGYAHAQPEALNAVLSLDEETYVLGQPMFFVLALKNTGKEPVRAHVAAALDGFDLEIASGREAFRPLAYRAVEMVGGRAPLRTLQPGEWVGTSDALLLQAPQVTAFTREAIEAAFRNRRLVCDKPGTYRLRAKVYVDFGDRQSVVFSNEVQFPVTPAGPGYQQFVDFAKRYVAGDLTLGPEGYEASRARGDTLRATPYHRYLVWMRMKHYLKERMGEDRPREDVPEQERAEREAYRLLAEELVGRPATRQTRLGEVALVYLALYYAQAGNLHQALSYADVLPRELPWSSRKGIARSIRRTLAKQGNAPADRQADDRAE
ncbi:MAG: hypothetical protein NTX40_02765 [Planctomycetota bacterium]|nr:hypothetical protein [Planctomycetota bacterium]